TMPSLHPILQALQSLGGPRPRAKTKTQEPKAAAFFAEGRFPAQELTVQVKEHGPLARPLTAAQAQHLHGLSQPSKFGHRERTLLDKAVRHSGEIEADDIELVPDPPGWARLLEQVSQALGSGPLEAWMHKLLIYGPGQFFKPHQDTEKREGMVGTLVLIWPSAHIGGGLRVQHAEQSATFVSQHLQTEEIRWCAFYADCRHEVLPVEEGWRVALTYDLVVPAKVRHAPVDAPNEAVLEAVRGQFNSGGGNALRPWVLMLDHEYTEHGLRWHLMKGEDRERVAALRAAADALGLTVHLALMEVQESWTAVTEYRGRHQRGGAVQPDELIERSASLDFWVDRDGQVGPHARLSIQASDTESFIETGPEHLVNEEYEGYMGNWGETLDYWYRRAALVIQSPAAAERSRYALDFAGALKHLRALARGPEDSRQMAAAQAQRVHDLLTRQVMSKGRQLFAAYADIAAVLPEDEAALDLLRDFNPATFLPSDAKALKVLLKGRGEAWMLQLIKAWGSPKDAWRQGLQFGVSVTHQEEDLDDLDFGEDGDATDDDVAVAHGPYARLWPAKLPHFVGACLKAELSPTVVEALFESLWLLNLRRQDEQESRQSPAARKASQRPRLQAVVEFVQALKAAPAPQAHLNHLSEHVLSQPALYPLTELTPLALAFGPEGASLKAQVMDALRVALARPVRAEGDHSVADIEWTCRCADCKPVLDWAASPTAEALIMSMAQSRRDHVERELQDAGAPFRTETLRQGSPHKLKLHKPAQLHRQEAAHRERWQHDLEKLRS
ncbi:MAG: 2OG-Fe(II) oxygenase, partial [Rubrivivax sp.]